MKLKYWSYQQFIIILELLSDIIGIAVSFYCAHLMYSHFISNPNMPSFIEKSPLIILVTILALFLFYKNDLYKKHHTILNIEETRLILKCTIYVSVLTFAIFELTRQIRQPQYIDFPSTLKQYHEIVSQYNFSNIFSRLELIATFLFAFLLLSIQRYFLYKCKQRLHLKGIGHQRVLIYGQGDLAEKLIKKIKQSSKSGYYLVDTIDSSSPTLNDELANEQTLQEKCQSQVIDKILVADATLNPNQMVMMLQKSQNLGVKLEFVPALHSLFVHQISLRDIDGLPLISVKNIHNSFLKKVQKRLFDIIVSIILIIILLPLIFIMIILIKCDSRGPLIFSQKRVGQNGKEFKMYKFRTMHLNSNAYEQTPHSHSDQRLTRVGRWLRRFSLDELPQLINVLYGDMSLVGPRPEMPFITEKYTAQEQERLRAKPGITGLWQISADRKLQIHENLDYDLYYIEHQDLLLDVVILMRTIYSVIRGIGAY